MTQVTQQLQRRAETAVSLRSLVESPAYKSRFNEVLRDRAPQFVASLVQLVNASPQLQRCEPNTIIAAAITAAALDLPIEKNLGFAYIVPYGDQAQFQIGYRGLVQLAIRTSQYKFLNVTPVYEGELDLHNPLTSEIVLDTKKRKSDKIVGYAAYFRLVNGFEHAEYWDVQTVEDHARRYSQAYKSGRETPWKTDFPKMAMKTVLKSMLSHWGIMSVEMQGAIINDESVRVDGQDPIYPDSSDPKVPMFDEPAVLPAPVDPPSPKPAAKPKAAKAAAQPSTPAPTPPEPSPAAATAPSDEPEPQAAASLPLEPETAQPQPAAPTSGSSALVQQLAEAILAAEVTEAQVLSFCAKKKLFRPDGQPAAAISELKGSTIELLTKNLNNPLSPSLKGIREEAI
jgi:recombination protein RecT